MLAAKKHTHLRFVSFSPHTLALHEQGLFSPICKLCDNTRGLHELSPKGNLLCPVCYRVPWCVAAWQLSRRPLCDWRVYIVFTAPLASDDAPRSAQSAAAVNGVYRRRKDT